MSTTSCVPDSLLIPQRFGSISRILLFSMYLLTLVACGGGDDSDDYVQGDGYVDSGDYGDNDDTVPPPPKIAGIWSGTWEGIDSTFGPVAGTWEAEISQNGVDVRGPMIFGGDIDCAEGKMDGTADAVTEVVSGRVHRDPCPFNEWAFTAFNKDEFIASGRWNKAGLSKGSFEGKRVARFTGPRIKYVYPPGGRAGSFITIVGERLDMDPVNDILRLGEDGVLLAPATVSDSVITLTLPGNILESEQLLLQTSSGEALSPKVFNTNVTSPNVAGIQEIPLGGSNLQPSGVAFSVNGRRAFVANMAEGSVSMINSEMGQNWISTVVLPGPLAPPGVTFTLPAGT